MKDIISRTEAIKQGLNKYFTGNPCAHGHIAERYVKNRGCTGCRDNVKAAYYVRLGRTKPEGRYRDYKARAKKKNILFTLDLGVFTEFWQKPCTYCGDPIETIGLDRIDNSKGYTVDNVCPCCKDCNTMKSNKPLTEWIDKLKRIVT